MASASAADQAPTSPAVVKVVDNRMTANDDYVGPFALMNVAEAKDEREARAELAKSAESDAKKTAEDIKYYEEKLVNLQEREAKLKQKIREAKDDEAKFGDEVKKHTVLMRKAEDIIRKYEEDKSQADARGHRAKAKSPVGARSSSSSSSSVKRRRRSKSAKRPVTPPRYAASGANYTEDQGRNRPLRLTELERVKYKDSVCNKCGAKGHHGRHCTEP